MFCNFHHVLFIHRVSRSLPRSDLSLFSTVLPPYSSVFMLATITVKSVQILANLR